MGSQTNKRLIYIVICLLLASFLVYKKSPSVVDATKASLSEAFLKVDGWDTAHDIKIHPNIIDALELDDYLFRSYRNHSSTISLYIGYYRTSTKIGAAHSPLVCFPGQGWEISIPQTIQVLSEGGTVNLERLLVSRGLQREILLYWYQSYDMTYSGTFMQKVHNFWSKLKSNPADNAFIRVSVPVKEDSIDASIKAWTEFIHDFYPKFISYITNEKG